MRPEEPLKSSGSVEDRGDELAACPYEPDQTILLGEPSRNTKAAS